MNEDSFIDTFTVGLGIFSQFRSNINNKSINLVAICCGEVNISIFNNSETCETWYLTLHQDEENDLHRCMIFLNPALYNDCIQDCGMLGGLDARSIKTIGGLALKSVGAMIKADVRWTIMSAQVGVQRWHDYCSWLIDQTSWSQFAVALREYLRHVSYLVVGNGDASSAMETLRLDNKIGQSLCAILVDMTLNNLF